MAKFGRFDSRNKKKNRNKKNSLSKDTKIKKPQSKTRLNLLLRRLEVKASQ